MLLKCWKCGGIVSSEVPDKTVVRGTVECPECSEADETEDMLRNAKTWGCFRPAPILPLMGYASPCGVCELCKMFRKEETHG